MARVVIVTAIVVLAVLAALFALGWVLSSRVIVPAPYSLMPEFEIVAVEPLEPVPDPGAADPEPQGAAATEPAPNALAVTLPVLEDPNQHADTRVEGTYGLLWDGGYGLLGAVLSASAVDPMLGEASEAGADDEDDAITADATATITRAVTVVEGVVPAAGAPARIDNFVYRRDPRSDFGIEYEELVLAGEHGGLRAWYVPAEGRTAVLLLHGRRRGELIETLRMIQPLHEMGHDVLALAYRNHDESAASSDGLYHYGASEWRDAIAGARLLGERGADRVILFGLSMGGAVALEALERWTAELPEPIGVILDSPLVDPFAIVEVGAVKAGLPLPGLLTRVALLVAGWRTGTDFGELRQASSAGTVPVPVMVFAGVQDTTVPVASVDEFTAALRTPLTYHRLPGVEHVEAWNHDPDAYAARLATFVAGLDVRALR